jgi:hypothetical protein
VEDLRDAAFGLHPEAEVAAAAARGSARQRWLAAVVLGARGHYAAATTLLIPLRHHGDPVLAALAGSALASHRRQLGGHAAARTLDAAALARLTAAGIGPRTQAEDPDGVDAAGALSDALLGLAADAIGLGRLGDSRRLLDRADAADAVEVSWRTRIRRNWVGAEVELAAGHPERAVPLAERAVNQGPSLRHRLKSDLVHAAARAVRGQDGDSAAAAALLAGVTQVALERGIVSLVWPSELLHAEVGPRPAAEARTHAARALHIVLTRTDAVGRALAAASPWVPTGLVHSGETTRTADQPTPSEE